MTEAKEFAGKIAVVTGGASGIGRGIAEELINRGAKVVIADIEEAPLQRAAAEIGAIGVTTDVSDAASVRALHEATLQRFGTVDILCNNAGVGPAGKLADLTADDWKWILGVNLWGCIHGVSQFLPTFLEKGSGYILNTASIGGLATLPNLGAYSVTKYGVVALSEALSQEFSGSNIGITVFCPGPVRSGIGASSRNRPQTLGHGALRDTRSGEVDEIVTDIPWMDAKDAGVIAVDAIARRALYVTTHHEMFKLVASRFDRISEAFAGASTRRS